MAGLTNGQIQRIKSSSLRALEVFVMSALAPIFFAYVGLSVDLWSLTGWRMPALVLAIACAGKIVGCYLGGRLGRLSHAEALAVGFGMNARGAMGLIVALIGLSLGLLTQEMYSALVLMAVVTSFMAPLLLRRIMPRIPLRPEERNRMADAGAPLLLPAGPLRVLVPTAGGRNAEDAFRLAGPLGHEGRGEVTALYVSADASGRPKARRKSTLPHGTALDAHLDAHLGAAAALVGSGRLGVRRVVDADVAAAIVRESRRDYDLILMGAAGDEPLYDPVTQGVVRNARVPVVLVSHRGEDSEAFTRILVPVDGSLFSRHAAELAFAYAGASGNAEVTLLHVADETRVAVGSLPLPERSVAHALSGTRRHELEAQLHAALGPTASRYGVDFEARILTGGAPGETIVEESESGHYDLLVLGAEDKVFGRPLFFGQGTATILERAGCTTAVLISATSGDGLRSE